MSYMNFKIKKLPQLLFFVSVLVLTYLTGSLVATNNMGEYICANKRTIVREKLKPTERLIEKSAQNIKCDSGKIGSKTYYNNNRDFNFKVVVPEDWMIKKYHDYKSYHITFGLQNRGFAISIYPSATHKESDIIAVIGDQFESRNEVVEIIDENTKKVVVTTEEVDSWVAENYFIKKDGFIFVIGNGAKKQEGFDAFFESFEFIDLE